MFFVCNYIGVEPFQDGCMRASVLYCGNCSRLGAVAVHFLLNTVCSFSLCCFV